MDELPPIILEDYGENTRETLGVSEAKFDANAIRAAMRSLLDSAKYAAQREAILIHGWRCTYRFTHQNNRVCNTANGTQSKNTSVRKRCQKCAQNRTNPKTILEEFAELLVKSEVSRGTPEDLAREIVNIDSLKTILLEEMGKR